MLKKREAKSNTHILIMWLMSKPLSIRHRPTQHHKHLLIHFNIISSWMRKRPQRVTASHPCSSPRVFLSIPSSPYISHQIYNTEWQGSECFPAPGRVAPFPDLGQVSARRGIVYKEAKTHTNTHAHARTIIPALPAFPVTLASWFVY